MHWKPSTAWVLDVSKVRAKRITAYLCLMQVYCVVWSWKKTSVQIVDFKKAFEDKSVCQLCNLEYAVIEWIIGMNKTYWFYLDWQSKRKQSYRKLRICEMPVLFYISWNMIGWLFTVMLNSQTTKAAFALPVGYILCHWLWGSSCTFMLLNILHF